MKAQIKWLKTDRHGQALIPQSSRYSTVARFDDDAENWPMFAWSIVLENITLVGINNEILADIRFLVSNAPQHFLHEGSHFELYEGHSCVAKGFVVGSV
ncbi:MAG: hypothetical protein EOM20_00040 [Spartobacteria bacterium]|nr:hypothetical protein [Spartobacteria bacterium]